MSTALFLGRFQPVPHKGHVRVVQEVMQQHKSIIIGLGSSQYSGTWENLLTVEERTVVFESLFRSLTIDPTRYVISAVPDIHDNERYVAHVVKNVPPFECVYSGNDLVQQLFQNAGYTVVSLPRYEGYEGTAIRKLLISGDEIYRTMIPTVSEQAIQTLHIIDRLRAVMPPDMHAE